MMTKMCYADTYEHDIEQLNLFRKERRQKVPSDLGQQLDDIQNHSVFSDSVLNSYSSISSLPLNVSQSKVPSLI